MRSSQGSLIHEAAALFGLVDSIDRFIAEQRYSYTYTDATQFFFVHARNAADATRELISKIVQQSTAKPEEIENRHRPELIIQKDRWRTLHTYIKPAADAHTLMLPTPLIRLATEHLQQARGMEGREIVVLLTPELMYYHNLPPLDLPEKLVFVELPYSQGPSLFANLTIYHEMGHYVYEKLTTGSPDCAAFKQLTKTMERSFEQTLGTKIRDTASKAWAKEALQAWGREIFCDLFAVRLLGPAFSFALIDLLSLIGLMRKGTETEFSWQHPAPALRFREHVRWLQRDGWWGEIKDLPVDHVEVLQELESRQESEYRFVHADVSIPGFTDTFVATLPLIHAVVEEMLPSSSTIAQDFSRRRSEIQDCMVRGIVPSKLIDGSRPASPTPVSMVNAAYCFYLTALPELMDKLEGQDPYNLHQRRTWIQKLEAWTLKAIEDYYLLTTSEEAF